VARTTLVLIQHKRGLPSRIERGGEESESSPPAAMGEAGALHLVVASRRCSRRRQVSPARTPTPLRGRG
jgi:hypothetical protein